MPNSKKPAQPEDDGLVTHVASETPGDVEAYWTPERMKAASAVPMPNVVIAKANEDKDSESVKSKKK